MTVTKAFRNAPDPHHDRCLRCGKHVSYPETGRPREYCGDACRQAGARLRRKHGYDWWKQQDWYEPWVAGEAARCERWERDRPERERQAAEQRAKAETERGERRKLLASMPPDVRKAFDEAEARARRESRQTGDLAILQIELDILSSKHEDLLRATGRQIRLIDGSRKMDKLLRSALYSENEAEARAMFAKARALRAAGDDLDEELSTNELFRKLLGTFGAET